MGIRVYKCKYIWSKVEYVEVIAQDIMKIFPEATTKDGHGFYLVDYSLLDVEMAPYEHWNKLQKTKQLN